MKRISQGATLLEVVVTVTILALFVAAFGGLLRSISVGGRNIPQAKGAPLAEQQLLDYVNAFLVQFSRDARGTSEWIIENNGTKVTLGGVTYECKNGEIARKENGRERVVLRGVSSCNNLFAIEGDSLLVTLQVQYRSQTGYGAEALEDKTFSFVVQRRVAPSPSP